MVVFAPNREVLAGSGFSVSSGFGPPKRGAAEAV